MKLYHLNKNYLNYIFSKIDDQVLYDHSDEKNSGRAYVAVKRMLYKGQYNDFAIPYKGEINIFTTPKTSYVSIDTFKMNANYKGGFMISKCMPIEPELLEQFNISDSQDFRRIASAITKKENDINMLLSNFLGHKQKGENIKFSTNIDKQLEFLNARTELMNHGVEERAIYGKDPKDVILIAATLREQIDVYDRTSDKTKTQTENSPAQKAVQCGDDESERD